MATRREFLTGSAGALATRLLTRPMDAVAMHEHDPATRGDAHDDGRHAFDFFHGHWQVHNRRLRQRHVGSHQWDEFPATLDCRPLLGGLGNIDEYRSAEVLGLSLRLFDPKTRQWSDRWASARDGVLGLPAFGRFDDGIGVFVGEDRDEGRRILSRATWSQIAASGFVWEQAASLDDGASWETNWLMRIARSAP